MAIDDTLDEPFPATDIIFECGTCGKSLVINALGAGLAITCPDCGAEQQVPLPDGAEAELPGVEPTTAASIASEEQAEQELPDISDVLSNAHEQINTLKVQVEELQFRRRFLEKRHTRASQGLQSLRQEMIMLRKATDRMDDILKTMEDPSAGDTQPMA